MACLKVWKPEGEDELGARTLLSRQGQYAGPQGPRYLPLSLAVVRLGPFHDVWALPWMHSFSACQQACYSGASGVAKVGSGRREQEGAP